MEKIDGISNFEIKNSFFIEKDLSKTIYFWYEQIDYLYFSNESYTIHLSQEDIEIISKIPETRDKLKVLGFKKNVEIKI